jgi:RNA polymerase sigma-70 factor (ECF subfamily)
MGTSTFNETAALVAARNGDQAAFGDLVRAYQRRAYAAAYSFVCNREDALELAQEAFARAFKAMHRFDPSLPFYPWLYRIIKNASLNYLKRKQRRGETSLEGMMESGFDARATGPNPVQAAELDDLKRSIHESMARLTPEQQEILRLRHFLEMSYAEIAETLDIPQGTVMSRLHSARQSLRRIVEQKEKEYANV